jgi:hypothetical protein
MSTEEAREVQSSRIVVLLSFLVLFFEVVLQTAGLVGWTTSVVVFWAPLSLSSILEWNLFGKRYYGYLQ